MRRLTVNLPDELHARLREDAAERDVAVATVVRAALQAYLAPRAKRESPAAGAGASGEIDFSERIKQLRKEEPDGR